jgi:hypothetical protein
MAVEQVVTWLAECFSELHHGRASPPQRDS